MGYFTSILVSVELVQSFKHGDQLRIGKDEAKYFICSQTTQKKFQASLKYKQVVYLGDLVDGKGQQESNRLGDVVLQVLKGLRKRLQDQKKQNIHTCKKKDFSVYLKKSKASNIV